MTSDANPGLDPEQEDARLVIEEVRAFLEYEASTGLQAVPLRSPGQRSDNVQNRPVHNPAVTPAAPREIPRDEEGPVKVVKVAVPRPTVPLPPGVAEAATLAELRAAIGECTRCKLAKGRTNLVFGAGNLQARLMFVGEAPGRDEDLSGEPFVGRAGQLLTDIITNGMKLQRADVYIANVVKCRPPENRNPEIDEIASCQPFLQRQIAIIRPKVIVALGTFAAQTLLNDKTPISKLRGRWFEYCGISLMPTFHPSYLLHSPGEKRWVWEDIKQVMRELEKHA